MLAEPLRVVVHPECWANDSNISSEAETEYLRMLQQDQSGQQLKTDNIACNNQAGSCFGLNPNPSSGIYWTGLFILAGCIVGAIVLRKVRR